MRSAAGDLIAGDELYLESGDTAVVTGSELEKLEEPIRVYNLEVADYNTYFVGDYAVLVHNYPDGEKTKGGSFRDVNASRGPDEVGHHMPQNAYDKTIGLSRDDAPALLMSQEDHKLTRTFGGRGKATMRMDEGLTARQRLALDIMDIKRLFGTKYNEGLRQLIDYAKSLPEFRKDHC